MSTSINQIIEVKRGDRWEYVPVVAHPDEDNMSLQHCGSVRDVFAYEWYDAASYMCHGVPDDISKLAREAMIYCEEDFIDSARWITAHQFEALTESVRLKLIDTIEKMSNSKTMDRIEERLSAIEAAIGGKNKKRKTVESDTEYIEEELEDLMWAWDGLERNWAEIEALVSHFTDDNYCQSDIRVVMFVS